MVVGHALGLALSAVMGVLVVPQELSGTQGRIDAHGRGGAFAALNRQSVSTSRGSAQSDFSTIREFINAEMGIGKATPSMAIAVARGNQILWEEGFGRIDGKAGSAATANTLYYTASVTKAVTATALMILHERRMLDLDRPANAYLKTAKLHSPYWNANEATLRQLATHTAGLTTYDGWEQLPAAETIRRYGVVFWRPGDHFDYSNIGFGVLGQIIADVSGRSFQAFVHDDVLRPLAMETAWAGSAPPSSSPVAPRFSSLLNAFSPPLVEPTLPGASMLYCSAHELALFGMWHLKTRHPAQKAVLSDRAIDDLQHALVAAGNLQQSLAWSVNENQHGYRTLLAQGGTYDSQAWLLLVPSESIAVVVLANAGNVLAMRVIDQVLAELLPVYRENIAKTITVGSSNAGPTEMAIPAGLLGTWSGQIHVGSANVPLTLRLNDSGDVAASVGKQPPTRMSGVRLTGNRVVGRVAGDLRINYADGTPYELRVELYRYDNRLMGSAVTYAVSGRDGPRLPFWVELAREQ